MFADSALILTVLGHGPFSHLFEKDVIKELKSEILSKTASDHESGIELKFPTVSSYILYSLQ